jgi:triacylglycerol lipase
VHPELPKDSASVVQNGLYFVHLANAAYLDDPRQYEYFDDFQLDQFKTFTGDDDASFALAGRIDGALVVAFRGTDDAEDAWLDLKFRQVEDYDGWVHEGFYNAATSLWDGLIKHLGKNWQDGDKVWVTGHSLGGAMATVMAKWLAHQKYDIAGVHTFGQPRVGDNTYADNYSPDDVHYRFVNNKDFVTHVPYRWMGPGVHYKHVGKVQLFDADGNLTKSDKDWDDLAEDFTDSMSIRSPLPKAKMPDFGFQDHPIAKYIKRIENYLRA